MKILLVGESPHFAPSAPFAASLAEKADILRQSDGAEALEIVGQNIADKEFFDVVCVGEQLAGNQFASGLEFAQTFAERFPLVNCALMGRSSAEDFHEETEGLGIVMQIPTEPSAEDAAKLLAILQKISGLL